MSPDTALHAIVDSSGRPVVAGDLPFDSLSLGRGVFETILVLSGKPVFARAHGERLAASCIELGIATGAEAACILAAGFEFAAGETPARGRLRTAVFAGADGRGPVGLLALAEASQPEVMSLAVSSCVRSTSDSLTRHKTVSYLANLVIRDQARKAGCDDALIVDSEGNVAETSTANVFLGLGSRIATPSLGCILPGIVRQWVLEAASAADVAVEECRVTEDALSHCEYAFVTNSVVGLVGVSQIAGRNLAPASSVLAFDRLQRLYRDQLRLAAS